MADDPSAPGVSTHDDTQMIQRRQRSHHPAAEPSSGGGAPRAAAAARPIESLAPPAAPPRPVWGLALSGGGIRSATLSLGVLQAIAATPVAPPAPTVSPAPPPSTDRAPVTPQGAAKPRPPRPGSFDRSLLSRFDYLSTVSGGGYIGAFLVSLFLPKRLDPHGTTQTAADDATAVLCNDPPGRVHAGAKCDARSKIDGPLAWLRDNGRYLSPTGGGDMFYAVALALRNWVAVHYVLGTVLLSVFACTALVSASVPALNDLDRQHLANAFLELNTAEPAWTDGWWPSALFLPAMLLLALWPLPSGLAYWVPQPGRDGRCAVLPGAFWGLVLVLALVGLAIWLGPLTAAGGATSAVPAEVWACVRPAGVARVDTCGALGADLLRQPLWVGWAISVLGVGHYLVARAGSDDVDMLRVRLTRSLTYGLLTVGALTALALVDSAAHTFYLALLVGHGKLGHALTPAGVTAGVIWLVRRFALTSDGHARPGWMQKLPVTWIAGVAGIAIMAVLATAWSLAVIALQWEGGRPDVDLLGHQQALLGLISAVALLLTFIGGWYPTFINLSSLQSFYGARITRAYLGASNGERFAPARHGPSSVAQPDAHDGVRLGDFLAKDGHGRTILNTRAPLHLVNVTINATVDPGEQLVQRDRKGIPLVVTPRGFSIDGGALEEFETVRPNFELQRTLSLGQWIGTSGAAFSTGIGRETSLGLSMLMGVANVRLGTWWESGSKRVRKTGGVAGLVESLFRTQSYLFDEFTAQFHGMARRWQYLSDGGHFENTALYELLRPSREVRFAVCCDHGADPDYRFDDLANLMRLVRIDMQVELQVEADVARDPVLAPWLGVPADFRSPLGAALDAAAGRPAKAPTEPGDTPPRHEPVGVLLRACHGQPSRTTAWVLLVKPRVRTDSSADVVQYALSNPAFPQQPTSDQFFDEAQWESYRKLAHDNASHLLAPPVWAAIAAYIARGGPPPSAPPVAPPPAPTAPTIVSVA